MQGAAVCPPWKGVSQDIALSSLTTVVLKLVLTGALKSFSITVLLCLSAEKNSARGKMVDKKWFIRTGLLWGLQSGRVRNATPWELTWLQFYNPRKGGEGENFYLSWADILLPSSVPPPGWAGEFSCLYMVKLGPQITVFMCAESMFQGSVTTGLTGRVEVSCHYCFIGLGRVLCFCGVILLLSKGAWFCS